MEPAEKTASPHQWRRTTASGPEEDHSRSRRSNGWAECREKNIGIEPMENTFLLTFLLIGHCYIGFKTATVSIRQGQASNPALDESVSPLNTRTPAWELSKLSSSSPIILCRPSSPCSSVHSSPICTNFSCSMGRMSDAWPCSARCHT